MKRKKYHHPAVRAHQALNRSRRMGTEAINRTVPPQQATQALCWRNAPQGTRCLLCGGAPDLRGIFAPTDPQAWGAPAGKMRSIVYSLCQGCQARPDVTAHVEARLKAPWN